MDEIENKVEKSILPSGRIHYILSGSYTMFLFAVIFGVIFDIVVPIKFLNSNICNIVGVVFIMLSTLLIYWAQSSSHKAKKQSKAHTSPMLFAHGPYKYMRNPTHFGVFVLTLGLGFLLCSPFSIIFTVIVHIISKIFILRKQDNHLKGKYGKDYDDYFKKVKDWI